MNVLSLFDGMSCGQIALHRAGITIGEYYASEVDIHAIGVTMQNYPDTHQLGDVTKWREWDIDWGSIDLLMGGSPCQGFSVAGNQLAFDDPRSKLFFVYVDILNHIKTVNKNVKFLLENVKMKADHIQTITRRLSVTSVCINSSLVSAQNREQHYWTNWNFDKPKDRHIVARDFSGNPVTKRKLGHIIIKKTTNTPLDLRGFHSNNSTSQRVYGMDGKLPTLLVNNTGGNNPLWITQDGGNSAYQCSVNLCEFLQTVPQDYTKNASSNQRYRTLGNGWTIDVVAHILRNLKCNYSTRVGLANCHVAYTDFSKIERIE